jgi:anthranilate/para-aminobenzoate synthase component II
MAEPIPSSDETASQFHIPGTGDLARLRIHERKLLRRLLVGSTYAIAANETSIRPSTVRWQGRYHNDEVVRVPENFEILAHTVSCPVEAIKVKGKPFYGLQFHPEVENTEHGSEIFQNFLKVVEEWHR